MSGWLSSKVKQLECLWNLVTNQNLLGWQLLYDRKWGAARELMERTLPKASRGMLTHQVDQARQIKKFACAKSF